MSQNQDFKFSNSVLFVPLAGMLLIWTVYWLELKLGVNFNQYGVNPRKLTGLRGVVLSPFIHGSREHLYNNTIPLVVLTAATFYFYRQVAWKVIVFGILFSGIFTWVIGRPSFHIGASGLIYVLVSFIFFKGMVTKHYRLIALSLVMVFLYGSMIWYIFPIEEGISWEGHLSGFLVGLIMAYVLKSPVPKERKFAWEREDYDEEKDEFMKHFDADGNFIENLEPEEEVIFKYDFKKDESKPN